MIDLASFKNLQLRGGFVVVEVALTSEPMVDALDREAIAQTRVIGREFRILIDASLSKEEFSISLYHEILEAATVASTDAPESVVDFNEGDFEREARAMHDRLGEVSPDGLNQMLQFFGF